MMDVHNIWVAPFPDVYVYKCIPSFNELKQTNSEISERTDGQTDGQTDGWTPYQYPPTNFVDGG